MGGSMAWGVSDCVENKTVQSQCESSSTESRPELSKHETPASCHQHGSAGPPLMREAAEQDPQPRQDPRPISSLWGPRQGPPHGLQLLLPPLGPHSHHCPGLPALSPELSQIPDPGSSLSTGTNLGLELSFCFSVPQILKRK